VLAKNKKRGIKIAKKGMKPYLGINDKHNHLIFKIIINSYKLNIGAKSD